MAMWVFPATGVYRFFFYHPLYGDEVVSESHSYLYACVCTYTPNMPRDRGNVFFYSYAWKWTRACVRARARACVYIVRTYKSICSYIWYNIAMKPSRIKIRVYVLNTHICTQTYNNRFEDGGKLTGTTYNGVGLHTFHYFLFFFFFTKASNWKVFVFENRIKQV